MKIYKVTNRINSKEYVGQTIKSLNTRRYGHIYDALNRRDTMYFHSAIRKYGPDNFTWIILHDDITDIEELNRLEIFYIGYYDTFENGYNLTEGGWNTLCSEKTKKKIGLKSNGKNNGMYGKQHSEESKRKQSKANKGKRHSEGSKRKISENHSDVSGKNNPMYGKFGRKHHNSRAIMIDNKLFDSLTEASNFFNITKSAIRYRILHKTKWLNHNYI